MSVQNASAALSGAGGINPQASIRALDKVSLAAVGGQVTQAAIIDVTTGAGAFAAFHGTFSLQVNAAFKYNSGANLAAVGKVTTLLVYLQQPLAGAGSLVCVASIVDTHARIGLRPRGLLVVDGRKPQGTPIYIGDRHVTRSGSDYAYAFARLLPRGKAWSRDQNSTIMKTVAGLTAIWGTVEQYASTLLERESDPRQTVLLLPDWERNWGLPDPCLVTPQTIGDRQRALVNKMTTIGGQSRAFFIQAAALEGSTIQIKEFSPFMCGISQCGDTRDEFGQYRWYIGPPEMRFYWTAQVGDARLTWFRAGVGQAGVDHHLTIGIPIDADCLLNRWKPAHTQVVFDFSNLATGGSMQGTP